MLLRVRGKGGDDRRQEEKGGDPVNKELPYAPICVFTSLSISSHLTFRNMPLTASEQDGFVSSIPFYPENDGSAPSIPFQVH